MELWEHQKEAIRRALPLDEFALLFEPGTGKSCTVINIIRQKFAQEKVMFKVLILCPTIVCDNWKSEWSKFSKVPQVQIEVLLGAAKKRAATIRTTKARILITNYQTLLMEDVVEELKKWNPKCIVADESHRIKNPTASTTKSAIDLAAGAKYKYILTGTPVLKNLMDFFSQFKFLDGGKTFGTKFTYFKNMYFYNKNANAPAHVTWPQWEVRPNAEKEIREKVSVKSMYVEKSACLDLPPLVRKEIKVELSREQLKHYNQMEKEFITYVNGVAATASIVLTKGLRLMQIVSGFMTLEDGTVVRFSDNPRLNALKEILSDIAPHHKVIVWACFKENYEMIREVCDELGLPFVEVTGDNVGNRTEAIARFQNDPGVRVLIGAQSAGGIGVNLTSATYSIYYSRNFSLEHDIQSEARNYRGGSEVHEKITRIDLVAKKTIDEKVLEALALKQSISDSVLKNIANKL